MLGQPAEVIIPAIADLLCLVRVDTHRGIDKRVPVSQLDGGPTGGEIAADRHKVLHAGFARSRDHGIAVAVEAGVIEMGVGIDQQASFPCGDLRAKDPGTAIVA